MIHHLPILARLLQRPPWLLLPMIACSFFTGSTLGKTYELEIAVHAGEKPIPAGQTFTYDLPIEHRLKENLGLGERAINPDTFELLDALGQPVEASLGWHPIEPYVPLVCRLRFAVPQRIEAKEREKFTLRFNTVTGEVIRHMPADERRDVDAVEVQTQPKDTHRWDFDPGHPPIEGTWHARQITNDQTRGTLTVEADGQYSAPIIGRLGPISTEQYKWLVLRGRRDGETPAKLLVNGKRTPVDVNGRPELATDFDTYAVYLPPHAAWQQPEAQLKLRWGYRMGQPTSNDRIVIDWAELHGSDSLVYSGRIRSAQASLDSTERDTAGDNAKVQAEAQVPRPSVEAFFEAAPVDVSGLPEDGIYPRGQTMGLSLFSVGGGLRSDRHPSDGDMGEPLAADRQALLEKVKHDGFTLIGPQYELNDRAIRDARSVGLKCIYAIGISKKHIRSDNPDFDAIEKEIESKLVGVADNPTIAWWYTRPEELRFWKDTEMRFLKLIYQTIKKADPLDRPVFMYEPNHRKGDHLARLMAYQDLSAKGSYVNYIGKKDNRVWLRWSVEQQVQAIEEAGDGDEIVVLVPEMFEQPEGEDPGKLERWARHDMYLGLTSGAKGAVIFSLRIRPGFTARPDYYEAYAKVTRELRGPLDLERVFLFSTPRHDLRVTVTEGPARLRLKDDFGARLGQDLIYPSVNVYNAAIDNERYLILVNSANQPVTVSINNFPKQRLTAESLFDDATQEVVDGEMQAQLPPLGVAGWWLAR